MLEAIAETAPAAWPLALTCATVVTAGRVRAGRRRERLNRCLHEMRRPLQALVLDRSAGPRWGTSAAVAGRRIEVAWRARRSRILCDPAAIARALDNLIVNALEHGSGPIGLAGVSRDGRLRLVVFDGGATGSSERIGPPLASPRRLGGVVASHRPGALGADRDRRRGHGLRVVAQIAAEHGGRFATCRDRAGASAVLEIPLADV